MFMAGEHRDAISRIDDLNAAVHFNSICYMVQARAQRAMQRISPLDNTSCRHICIFSLAICRWRGVTSRLLSQTRHRALMRTSGYAVGWPQIRSPLSGPAGPSKHHCLVLSALIYGSLESLRDAVSYTNNSNANSRSLPAS